MRAANVARVQSPKIWTPFPLSGTCKIMPVGTSITNGKYGNNVQDSRGGYRGPLYDRVLPRGCDLVGTQTGPVNTGSGHEGYAGITVAGVAAFLAARLATHTPHCVLVELGMNEVDSAGAATACATDIVDLCFATLPNCLVLVQNVIPTYPPNLHLTYNAQLAVEVGARRSAGKHIELIDMYNQCGLIPGPVDYTESTPGAGDWVHPSAIGYPKMAVPIMATLSKYLR